MLRTLWNDQAGAIISAELVLVLTIAVLAMIVGLSEVAVAVNEELNDISNAVGNMDQSYYYVGFEAVDGNKAKSRYAGGITGGPNNRDTGDLCDKNVTVVNCNAPVGECGN